jgi:hypothetical protein
MTPGKGFTRITARRGNIFQTVLQIVWRQGGADLAGEGARSSSVQSGVP